MSRKNIKGVLGRALSVPVLSYASGGKNDICGLVGLLRNPKLVYDD